MAPALREVWCGVFESEPTSEADCRGTRCVGRSRARTARRPRASLGSCVVRATRLRDQTEPLSVARKLRRRGRHFAWRRAVQPRLRCLALGLRVCSRVGDATELIRNADGLRPLALQNTDSPQRRRVRSSPV